MLTLSALNMLTTIRTARDVIASLTVGDKNPRGVMDQLDLLIADLEVASGVVEPTPQSAIDAVVRDGAEQDRRNAEATASDVSTPTETHETPETPDALGGIQDGLTDEEKQARHADAIVDIADQIAARVRDGRVECNVEVSRPAVVEIMPAVWPIAHHRPGPTLTVTMVVTDVDPTNGATS